MGKKLKTTVRVTLPLFTKINEVEVSLGSVDVDVPVEVEPSTVTVDPALLVGALLETMTPDKESK
jgi:hypothetical protein